VGGSAAGRPWIGPAMAFALVAAHLARAAEPFREGAGIAAIAALGTLWEVLPAATGLIEYRSGVPALSGVPFWIAALWLAFATTLNVSLRWLRERPLIAALTGAVAGPACYGTAATLGALVLTEPRHALAAQAAAWAVLLPIALGIAARCDGVLAQPLEHPLV
jgi:hypothetical protein